VSVTTMTDHPTLGREDLDLLRLLAEGLSLETVARRLDLSEPTVRRRVRSICDRLGLDTPIEAVVGAAAAGSCRSAPRPL
jgi:DNA-binding NarL/FixJ family response regulator